MTEHEDHIASELLERAEEYAEEHDIDAEDVDWDEVREETDDDHRFRQFMDR